LRHLSKYLVAGTVALALNFQPLIAAAGLIRDAEIERTLKSMSSPIFKAAGFPSDKVDIYILNDKSLNAFVANSSSMFLHTGLLQTLETPEELQAVIAHEAGHISGGHLARRQINFRNARGPALLGLLVGIAAGVAGGSGGAAAALAAGSQAAVVRTLLHYNRGEEAAADQAALEFLDRANIDPSGMARVLGRFRGQELLTIGNIDPFVLTHPLSSARLQLIDRRIAETEGRQYPVEADLIYWHGRMRAKLAGYLDNPERIINRLEGQDETEEVLYTKTVALYRLPAMADALAAADRLIALRPNDPFYIEVKGQILFETGHPEEAAPLYREAVRLAPGEPLLEAGLGRALLALNRPETDAEALQVLQNARRHDLGDATSLRSLATAYSRAGNQGMAALATAERYALRGNISTATLHAGRAATVLPEGSPGWLRAQDILSLKPE
jgi:predicted Zn-dependent protease